MKKFFSFAAAAAAVIGGVYARAAPAGADIDAYIPPVRGGGSAGIVAPLNAQQKLVHFECTASATVASASTSVDSCELYADGAFVASAQSISLSGQAAATASTAAVPSLASTLQVCWQVSADPIFGDRVTSGGCSNVNTAVLAA